MATVPLTTVLHHLRSLAVDEWSDVQLLERFAGSADEAAFAALVRRHGALVLGVAGRVLGAGPDLDDVFQATFLVLARRARSIRNRTSLASWLYGVAFRLALRLKSQRSRRRQLEQTGDICLQQIEENPTMRAEPGARASLRELGTILDEELQSLPATCRDALVLCHLEGLSCSEAAQQLGWPIGTLKGRLLRGRNLLRKRLERRGVALSSAGLALVTAAQAEAGVPASLVHGTLQCVIHQVVSARVAALALSAARSLTAGKLKLAALAFALVGLLGFGVALLPVPAASVAAGLEPRAMPQAKEPPVLKDLLGDPLPNGAVVRLGTVRWRHGGPVFFLALQPDGKTAVSAANDRFVRVWDQATGKELHRFGPGPRPESGPAILVSASLNKIAAAVSSDGRFVATWFGEKEVQLWELATGKKTGTIALPQDFNTIGTLSFAPDGKRLALARFNGPVGLWDLEAGKIVSEWGTAPKTEVRSFAGRQSTALFSPDGKTLVTSLAESDGTEVINQLRFWDLETGKERFSVKVAGSFGIHAPTFSPDGKLLAYATHEGQACLLRASDGTQLRQWKIGSQPEWYLLAFSLDSSKLYSMPVFRRQLQEWDVKTAKPGRQLPHLAGGPLVFYQYNGPSGCLAVSADGKTLSAGGGTNTVRFVDLATGKEVFHGVGDANTERFVIGQENGRSLAILHAGGDSHSMLALSFAPDGKSVVTRTSNGQYQLWDAVTGKLLKQMKVPHQGYNFVTSPDGRYGAVWDMHTKVFLVDNTTGAEVATIPSGRLRWPIFFFGPDSKTLLLRRLDDNAATLCDVPSGKERCQVDVGPGSAGPNSMVAVTYFFSPDGRRLAVYSKWGRPLTIHDSVTGKELQSIPLLLDIDNRQPYGAFSSDGRTIAIDYRDGLVQVIELATGKVRRSYGKKFTPKGGWPLALEYGTVWPGAPGSTMVAFSPDGRLLAQVGVDNAVVLWDVETGQSLGRYDGHTGPIGTIAFAPDGRCLATASADTTALIWDVQALAAKAGVVPRPLDAEIVKARWADLAAEDAAVGYEAVCALVAAREQALALFKQRLRPAAPIDGKRVAGLIDQLNSEGFNVRQKAQADLLKIGDQVVPLIAQRLQGQNTLEMQKRLEELHAKLTAAHWSGERLQLARAIEVLERIAGAEARQVLQTLADGAPGAFATNEAQAAVKRLAKSDGPR
jgi:RNA polymerase sigma factor (sigma-70 family)